MTRKIAVYPKWLEKRMNKVSPAEAGELAAISDMLGLTKIRNVYSRRGRA